jgi:hypothetical protein
MRGSSAPLVLLLGKKWRSISVDEDAVARCELESGEESGSEVPADVARVEEVAATGAGWATGAACSVAPAGVCAATAACAAAVCTDKRFCVYGVRLLVLLESGGRFLLLGSGVTPVET